MSRLMLVCTCVMLMQQIARAEAVVHLTFDEGSGTTIGDAVGGHDAAVMGTSSPQWVDGKFGGGLDFDGSYYADLPFQFPIPGSLSLWYYIRSFYNYNDILDNSGEGSDDPGNDWELWIQAAMPAGAESWFDCAYCVKTHLGGDAASRQAGKVGYDLRNFGGGDPDQAVDQWYHVAITWDEEGLTTLYVNGVQRGTATSAGVKPAGQHIYLAGNQPSNINTCPDCQGTRHGTGIMDELQIFNNILTEADVEQLYEATAISSEQNAKRQTPLDARVVNGTISLPARNEAVGVTVYDMRGRALIARQFASGQKISLATAREALPGGAVIVRLNGASGAESFRAVLGQNSSGR